MAMMNCTADKRLFHADESKTLKKTQTHMSKNWEWTSLPHGHIIKSIVQKRLRARSPLKCKYIHVGHSLSLSLSLTWSDLMYVYSYYYCVVEEWLTHKGRWFFNLLSFSSFLLSLFLARALFFAVFCLLFNQHSEYARHWHSSGSKKILSLSLSLLKYLNSAWDSSSCLRVLRRQ